MKLVSADLSENNFVTDLLNIEEISPTLKSLNLSKSAPYKVSTEEENLSPGKN